MSEAVQGLLLSPAEIDGHERYDCVNLKNLPDKLREEYDRRTAQKIARYDGITNGPSRHARYLFLSGNGNGFLSREGVYWPSADGMGHTYAIETICARLGLHLPGWYGEELLVDNLGWVKFADYDNPGGCNVRWTKMSRSQQDFIIAYIKEARAEGKCINIEFEKSVLENTKENL